MKKTIVTTMVAITLMMLAGQSLAVVDSTTDNQLPSIREDWQNPSARTCPYIGEMDIESNADYQGNVYQDKHSDIEEMESGGDPELGWVS